MYKKEVIIKNKDGTKVLIREPSMRDAKKLMIFINSFTDETKNGITVTKKTTLAKEKKWLKNKLKEIKKNQSIHIIAEHNNKIIGGCDIRRKRFKEDHRAEIGIAIIKEYRHKGIGTIILKELFRLAKKKMKGLKIIELKVIEYNKKAKGLYKKIGFKKVATIPKAIKEGNKYFAEEVMQLYIK